jgi:hypothetical protein
VSFAFSDVMLRSLISFTDASEECSASIFRPEEKGMREEKYHGYKEKVWFRKPKIRLWESVALTTRHPIRKSWRLLGRYSSLAD